MAQRLRERLNLQAAQNYVGRTQELAQLLRLLDGRDAAVVFVHGIGGIGKSSLLEVFTRQAQTLGAVVVKLDCRAIKPSPEGFLHELSAAIGGDATEVDQLAQRLSRLGERVILTLDTYEVFRMMDTWLRQVFIPALNENVRIVLFGREAPVSTWYTTPGWEGMVQSILLGPLSNHEAKELLLQCGIPEMDTARVTHFTRGHPLALKLAAATIVERPNLNLKEVESQLVVNELTQLYLADVPDPTTRVALEAASVVRRTTHSLLGAMLPDIAPNDAYDRLRALPFVESASDGLMIHDLVQQAIVAHLQAADPQRFSHYRRAAWHQLRSEFSPSSRAMSWRYTADMIYLIDNPAIHEVFFPSDAHLYGVEQATPQDGAAIGEITLRHDGPETWNILRHWWELVPEAFHVVRGRPGEVAGYYCILAVQPSTNRLHFDDPVTRLCWQHLQANPIPNRQIALFVLKSLAAETGDRPSPVQGPLSLDLKRNYMEHPETRRVFSLDYSKEWLPVISQLGFRQIGTQTLDGKEYFMTVNDFGPQLALGWMAGLVDAELGLAQTVVLNVEGHELVIGDKHIGLTPLELQLMQYLIQREGKAVTRDAVLNEVWGYSYDGGSNVVDRIIRSLRKKLGNQANAIETVSGVGYKLRWSS